MFKDTHCKLVLGFYIFAFAIIAVITGVNVPFAIFLAYSIICCLLSFKLNIKSGSFCLLVFSFALLLRVACILCINTPPESDFRVLFNAARTYSAGDYTFSNDNYFYEWAYQTGFVIYQGIVIKILGAEKALLALKLLNAVYSSMSCILIYCLAKNYVSEKTARFSSLICAGLIFPLIFSTVLSNQHLSTFLALLGLFIITDKNSKLHGMLRHVIAGFFLALSNIIRPEGVLFLGSLLVAYLIRFIKPVNEKRRKIAMSYIVLLVIYFGTNFLADKAVIESGVNSAGLRNNNVLWKFVEGLNYESKGTYSQKDAELVFQQDLSREERKELELSLIKERLKMGPKKWVQLMINKQFCLWGDTPLFWTYRYLEKSKDSVMLFGRDVAFSKVTDLLDDYHSMQMFILIVLSLIGAYAGFRDKVNMDLLVYYLILLFTAGVYIIVEVQARYVYPAEYILIVPAAIGIERIYNLLLKIKEIKDVKEN